MPTNAKIKKIRTPKPKVKTKAPNKNNISFGKAVQINKDRQVTKQFDEKKKKKQLEALSGILGAASDLTRGGGGGGAGSSSNTDFGRAPIPTGHTEEDFWHPETTESGSPNDNG